MYRPLVLTPLPSNSRTNSVASLTFAKAMMTSIYLIVNFCGSLSGARPNSAIQLYRSSLWRHFLKLQTIHVFWNRIGCNCIISFFFFYNKLKQNNKTNGQVDYVTVSYIFGQRKGLHSRTLPYCNCVGLSWSKNPDPIIARIFLLYCAIMLLANWTNLRYFAIRQPQLILQKP